MDSRKLFWIFVIVAALLFAVAVAQDADDSEDMPLVTDDTAEADDAFIIHDEGITPALLGVSIALWVVAFIALIVIGVILFVRAI